MFKKNSAFGSFSVNELAKAKKFYSETLGLNLTENTEMGLLDIHIADNFDIMVYPKPDHSPATFTILNFHVDDIGKSVDELSAKGVTFEHYDYEGIKTDEKGIMRGGPGPSIAWFKDPAGNILSVIEDK